MKSRTLVILILVLLLSVVGAGIFVSSAQDTCQYQYFSNSNTGGVEMSAGEIRPGQPVLVMPGEAYLTIGGYGISRYSNLEVLIEPDGEQITSLRINEVVKITNTRDWHNLVWWEIQLHDGTTGYIRRFNDITETLKPYYGLCDPETRFFDPTPTGEVIVPPVASPTPSTGNIIVNSTASCVNVRPAPNTANVPIVCLANGSILTYPLPIVTINGYLQVYYQGKLRWALENALDK